MESTTANALLTIQQEADEILKLIFNRTENEWKAIYTFLKQKQTLEFFNGTCSLSNITVNGVNVDAIVIVSEQNLDFLVVFNENAPSIDFYSFEHYYNEEGDDSSLLADLLVEKRFEDYTPMIRITNNAALHDSPIQYFNKLHNFYLTTYKAICMEMKLEKWTNDDTLWMELEEQTHKQFAALFKTQKDQLIHLYLQLKDKKEGISSGNSHVYVQSIKVRDRKEEEDGEIDSIFEKLFGRKFSALTKEEKEARGYRDALIFDNGKEQFITVFRTLNDDDMFQNQLISLYYCTPNNERFTSLSFLMSAFQHFKNHPIYEIHFNHNKYRNDVFYSAGSLTSDIRYFPYLSNFLTKLSHAEAAI